MTQDAIGRLLSFARSEIDKPNAYLVPLRVFIGIGWLRAAAEKIIDPLWYDGTKLRSFLSEQAGDDLIVFPQYEWFVETLVEPNAAVVAWVVLAGQLLAGLAILTGTFTNLGLLGGLIMNANFLLAGAIDPSAFYIVIQTVLFVSNTGAVLGVDSVLSSRVRWGFLVARTEVEPRYLAAEKLSYLVLTAASAVIAGYAVVYIEDFSPNAVDDPATVLFVLASLGGLSAFITYLRHARAERLIAAEEHADEARGPASVS